MKKYIFPSFSLIVLFVSWSCQDNKASRVPLQDSTAERVSKNLIVKSDSNSIKPEVDCVFNNDIKGDTEKAIYAYDKNLTIVWNKEQTEATVQLKDGDHLKLSIGGCSHYGYNAYLNTSINYSDQVSLLKKMVWLANTFFGVEYGKDYEEIVNNKWFRKDRIEHQPEGIYFAIQDTNTSETNIIKEGFTFYDLKEKGSAISLNFYIN